MIAAIFNEIHIKTVTDNITKHDHTFTPQRTLLKTATKIPKTKKHCSTRFPVYSYSSDFITKTNLWDQNKFDKFSIVIIGLCKYIAMTQTPIYRKIITINTFVCILFLIKLFAFAVDSSKILILWDVIKGLITYLVNTSAKILQVYFWLHYTIEKKKVLVYFCYFRIVDIFGVLFY